MDLPISSERTLTNTLDVSVRISRGSGERGKLTDVSEDGSPVLGSLIAGLGILSSNGYKHNDGKGKVKEYRLNE